MRTAGVLAGLSLLCCGLGQAWAEASFEAGERTSFALNDYTRLGQSFTASERFNILCVTAPSWNDNEGGFTLSLYDSPARGRLIAREQFRDFADNATLFLYIPQPQPPGTYYWEISDRVGETRVGLYAFRKSTYAGGVRLFRCPAERGHRFRFLVAVFALRGPTAPQTTFGHGRQRSIGPGGAPMALVP